MGPQDASDRIWLKQSVQFSVAGQVRTIEITLPVRPGASAEEIERLLKQADAGLDQMTQHLNGKINDLLDQARTQAPPGGAGSARRVPRAPNPEEMAGAGERNRAGGQPGRSGAGAAGAGRPASFPGEAAPMVAGPALDRKEFIAEIAAWGLSPRMAMARLGLNTLEGVNLRQALEQLRLQLLHERPSSSEGPAASSGDEDTFTPDSPPPRGPASPSPGASPRRPAPELKHVSPLTQVVSAERATLRPFVDGDGLVESEEQPGVDGGTLERYEPPNGRSRSSLPIPIRGQQMMSALQEQVQAKVLLERLRSIQGRKTLLSADHVKTFHHVVTDQLEEEKMVALLQAVWGVSVPERLSPDQMAECIRWGHDDDFEEKVDLLLKYAPEES
jgi:hypothetical protein